MDTYKRIEERFREHIEGRGIDELLEEFRYLAIDQPSSEELARQLGISPPRKPVGRVVPIDQAQRSG